MSRRRERPLSKLPISLEALPPPEARRTERMMLSWSPSELAMIAKAARERGEQPAVLCRTIVLTAFQNSAARALAEQPDLLEKSSAEQMKRLLENFATE